MKLETVIALALGLRFGIMAQSGPPDVLGRRGPPHDVIEMRPGDTQLMRSPHTSERRLSRWLELDVARRRQC